MDRAASPPLPPLEMRELVGPVDDASFDNPSGDPVFAYVDVSLYETVFDFGCGCGRVARQLLQQRARPRRYVGIDLHRGMARWCQENLAPAASGFEFRHHDVFNYSFNPDRSRPDVLPFGEEDDSFTLVNAYSVFTHLTQAQAEYYLEEASRILAAGGVIHSTWFLFDKREFPMLQERHNALYASDIDPCAAVLFDREWVRERARNAGLVVYQAFPPVVRGYQWILLMAHVTSGRSEVLLPADTAPLGFVRLADEIARPSEIGSGSDR
jgi:SAM-dependent methyltransferase